MPDESEVYEDEKECCVLQKGLGTSMSPPCMVCPSRGDCDDEPLEFPENCPLAQQD